MTAERMLTKPLSVNPLKVSPALGGALAFLGIDRALPLFHGAQGCTAFALVMAVRHFREAIPLQTTAMSELTTILGGADNVEEAIANIHKRAEPRLIGICSTALTETRDEDIAGDLKRIVPAHPEWEGLSVVAAATPDYLGGLEDGWAEAVEAMIEALVQPVRNRRTLRQVNLLPGSHLTPADVEALRDLIEAFGLHTIVLPDLSGSLDGHVPHAYVPTTLGGTTVEEIAGMSESVVTLAIGEHMRKPADRLAQLTGVPVRVLQNAIGLDAVDALVTTLMEVSGTTAPERVRRERSRLVDAMLDGHFFFSGQSVAVAGNPDEVFAVSTLLDDLGCTVTLAVSSTRRPVLADVPAKTVIVGDLGDLETRLTDHGGISLIVANSNARQAAEHLGVPHLRFGFPVFDRLGAAQRVTLGYAGTRSLIFEIADLFLAGSEKSGTTHHPARPGPLQSEGTAHDQHRRAKASAD